MSSFKFKRPRPKYQSYVIPGLLTVYLDLETGILFGDREAYEKWLEGVVRLEPKWFDKFKKLLEGK